MGESPLKPFPALAQFGEHLEMHRLDCLASHRDLTLYEFVRQKLAATPEEQIRPAPLVTGDDLIIAGYTPGPRFKEILAAVEDAQLEGAISSKEEGIKLVRGPVPISGS